MKALLKLSVLGAALCSFANLASAQFDGPTPLAWRWLPSSVDYHPVGTPLVLNNTVYVAAGTRYFALDADTGNEKWKFPREGAKGTFRYQPIQSGNTIVNVTDNGYFYSANIADGSLKWVYQLLPGRKISPLGQPVAVGSLIVFKQSDDSLNAIYAESGQPAWPQTFHVDTGFNGPLIVHGDDVIFANNDNEMYSLSAASMKLNWQRKFGFLPPGLLPTLYGDNLYLYSGNYLACVNTARGTGRWQVNLNQSMEFGPAVSPDGIMCTTDDGHLYFFDLMGHRALREVVDLGSGPSATPSALGTKFLVPTNNGALNLIDPKTGGILWSFVVRPITSDPNDKKVGGPTTSNLYTIDPRILTVPASGPALLNGDTMMILCYDASLLAFNSRIGVDLTPPDIDMLFPTPGMQLAGTPPLDLLFKVNDEATGINIKTLKIDVDGTPLEFTIGRDGVAQVHFSYEGKNQPLMDGRRIFTITISDWIGNTNKKSFALNIDNTLPPIAVPADLKGAGSGGKGKGAGGGGGGGGAGGGIG